MAKQDRWLLGRLPGWISGPVCVCVFSLSQSHASPLDNGIAGPHQGWVVAPSRDPIMPVPLRVATWKRGLTVITAWPSGREDTLSVSPRRNAWMSLSCLPARHLFFFFYSPINPLHLLLNPPHMHTPLTLFFLASVLLHFEEKQHAPVRYENQNQEDNKRFLLIYCADLFSAWFWIRTLAKLLICFDHPFWAL